MLSVITSFKDLIAAVFDAIFSTIRSAIDKLCWFLIAAFMSFIAGIPRMMLHMVKGISEAIGGLGGFITSKSLYPLIIPGGAYGYLEHQRQGQPIKGRLEVELDNEWKGDYAGE
ncbi:hypothetical protein ASPFODRAFT_201208 [Aspergillus luchuensis CBS 106.47]|uniref:Uncharacterized protein n=1 Tax=Aspergillus luchuensis (strain CBS 106.47) TaxID=1137211 RepID=A0A1M3SZ00_ASPLC|nr:hypothetical protein ASPFODRAFT_201208 [Aspergillus luchuensis CBS 106.47]